MDCADRLLIAAALGLGVAGCNVFDENLIPRLDASTGRMTDGNVDELPNPQPGIDVSDDCNNAPLVNPTNDLRPLRPIGANCGGIPPASVSCLDEPLAGKNFYFSFVAPAADSIDIAQKWHVHAANTGGKVTLYVLNSCAATTSCSDQQNAGIRTNNDEHLSFQVLPSQQYIVVVNTAATDPCDMAQRPSVLLQHDICGDSVPQHGEACDPPSASCVACRAVLAPNSQGREPNDSPLDANIIPMGNDTFTVSNSTVGSQMQLADAGTITGIDPYDFFRLQAQTSADYGKMVNVTLSWHDPTGDAGAGCNIANLAAIYITDKWFVSSNIGYNSVQALLSLQSGQCVLSLDIPFAPDPQSDTLNLSQYFIRVAAQPGNQVTYTLTVKFDTRDQ